MVGSQKGQGPCPITEEEERWEAGKGAGVWDSRDTRPRQICGGEKVTASAQSELVETRQGWGRRSALVQMKTSHFQKEMRASGMREPRSDLPPSKARGGRCALTDCAGCKHCSPGPALAMSGQKSGPEAARRASVLGVTEPRFLGHLVAAEDL